MTGPTRKDLQFMELAIAGAGIFSTCGKAQFMALILDVHGHVLGSGYNGGPRGWPHCRDGGCPRLRNETPSGSSYDDCIAIHAEANAIIHTDYSVRSGGTLYVNGIPCITCAKLIINSGLTRVVYLAGRSAADELVVREFLEAGGIELIECEAA